LTDLYSVNLIFLHLTIGSPDHV